MLIIKHCPDCDFENVGEAVYCRNCGVKLKKAEVEQKPVDNASAINQHSIVSKLFFKTDKYSGNLRIGKAKSISIIVFVIFFLFGISMGSATMPFVGLVFTAILFGLIFAIITFVIGFILGWIVNRLTH